MKVRIIEGKLKFPTIFYRIKIIIFVLFYNVTLKFESEEW